MGFAVSSISSDKGSFYCRRCGMVVSFEPTPKPLTMKEMHKKHREMHPNDKISFGEKPVKNWTTREMKKIEKYRRYVTVLNEFAYKHENSPVIPAIKDMTLMLKAENSIQEMDNAWSAIKIVLQSNEDIKSFIANKKQNV
jgi:isocitrate lyase